ncbi:DUF3060 domain-containing protein [Frigoribacterium sp. PvP032]|uniref:DUF3060 domain-containing protein n=1 Tax=Frigoribacterium sp. PvP032 TaxID=2806589 RepID=UPI001AE60EE9|nr:DUF3060 domain-containing protein [Frigoribacterium sp. PvP032]MBP1189378.1 hypothetical protein [Frigoribacterium sp. PvP032]
MSTRPTTRLALGGLAALALVAGLAACTSSDADTTPTPSTTPSATAEADASADAADDGAPTVNECVDGQAVISGGEKTVSLPDGCDTVYIVTSDATVDLGPVTKLFFEGTGNTVTYTGDAPEIGGTTDGDGNTATAS